MSNVAYKLIDIRNIIKKVNQMANISRYIETVVNVNQDFKILSSTREYVNLRFSKTKLKQEYKKIDLAVALREEISKLMSDVYLEVTNTPIISNYLENRNIVFNDIVNNMDCLYDIIYTHDGVNTVIVKIINPQ